MLKKHNVQTRQPKEFLLKYLSKENVLKMPILLEKKHTPYFSNILCKFFVKNSCTKGEECIFSHDFSQFQCPSMASNESCNELDCKYSHNNVKSEVDASLSACVSNELSIAEKVFMSPFV